MNRSIDIKRHRYIYFTFCLIFSFMLSCSINDPVDSDYFNDIDKIKGKHKPEPAPVIDDITKEYNASYDWYEIEIDFTSTTTIDPDTGTNENLRYYIYYSFTDPDEFESEEEYYDTTKRLGYINQSDFEGEEKKVLILSDPLGKWIYFWITAMDDGRESDHSKVADIYIDD